MSFIYDLRKKIKKDGFELGCYSEEINDVFTKKALNEVFDRLNVGYDSTDILLRIRKALYILEISIVDNEVDFVLLTALDYFCRYQDEDYVLKYFDENLLTEKERDYFISKIRG